MQREDSLRVLLVDDEPLILASYRRILQSLGVEITLAEGPIVGLTRLEEQPADVVVADYRMPGMNGGEFLEEVRRRWPSTVRMLITAYTDVHMIEEVIRRGEIFRFLIKPCETEKLRQALRDALQHSQELREVRQRSEKRELDLHTYRHMFESSLDPMMIADLKGSLVQVNSAFVRTQEAADELDAIDKRPSLRSRLELEGEEWEQIERHLRLEGHWAGEVNANDHIAALTISRLTDDNGHPYAYAAVEKDISTRRRLEQQARAAQYEVILALARLAEYRDPETGAHLERMQRYSRTLAQHLSTKSGFSDYIDNTYVEAIYNSSPLHDIGKVGIRDSVLLKPGRLTPDEWRIMQTHTLIGAEVLSAAGQSLSQKNWLSLAHTIALQHHERYDGTGYPCGLAGREIDISARIVALADAYDAMTSKRVYKSAVTHGVARQRIIESSGTHFDPRLVEAFLEVEDSFVEIQMRYGDDHSVHDEDEEECEGGLPGNEAIAI